MKNFLTLIIFCFFGGHLVAQTNSSETTKTPQLTSQKSYKGIKDSGKTVITLKKVTPKLKTNDYKERIPENIKTIIKPKTKNSKKNTPKLMATGNKK